MQQGAKSAIAPAIAAAMKEPPKNMLPTTFPQSWFGPRSGTPASEFAHPSWIKEEVPHLPSPQGPWQMGPPHTPGE